MRDLETVGEVSAPDLNFDLLFYLWDDNNGVVPYDVTYLSLEFSSYYQIDWSEPKRGSILTNMIIPCNSTSPKPFKFIEDEKRKKTLEWGPDLYCVNTTGIKF